MLRNPELKNFCALFLFEIIQFNFTNYIDVIKDVVLQGDIYFIFCIDAVQLHIGGNDVSS